MDLETETSILRRLEALEAKVAELTRKRTPESPEAVAARIASLVGAVDHYGLEVLLRETSKANWPSIFALQPLEVLQKLRGSMSKNAWAELVETWQQATPTVNPDAQGGFVRLASVLGRMGRILIGDSCDLHTKLTTSPWVPEMKSQVEEGDRRDELGTAAARQWSMEVLAALV